MTDLPELAMEAARDALFNDFDPYTKWCGVCSSQLCDDCILCRHEAATAVIEAAMPYLRAYLSEEIIAHRDYAQQHHPVPEFLVGLETAASVIRSGS